MTNREWLNGLSNEEFAKKLADNCLICTGEHKCSNDVDIDNCYGGHLKWLQLEHEDKLKKCPFCGSKYVEVRFNHGDYYVICTECCASTTTSVTRELAIEIWNQRLGDNNGD